MSLLSDHLHGVIHLSGDLDVAAVPHLRAELRRIPDDHEVLVDISAVTLLTAAAIGAFVHEAKRRPGGLRLRNLTTLQCKVLAITNAEWLVTGRRRA